MGKIRKWLNGDYYIETIALTGIVIGITFAFILIKNLIEAIK
jgi:hypothetical protein